MPVNRQTVRELSRTTLYNITSSGQAWRAFLDAAARLYKYSFPEQVLIYAQEPEATACAATEVWYTRMKRSLRPDAQAIALPDPHSHFGRLKYVFDVRETQPLPGAPEFRQWSLPFEALERVTDRLGQEYGISREPVVADRVYALEMFCLRDLLEGSVPAKVMNRAYEYVIKQDLLSVLRETPLTHQQLSVLTPQRRPLDFLYRLWLKTEYSHIDALRRAVRRETRRIYLKRQTEAFRKEHPMG